MWGGWVCPHHLLRLQWYEVRESFFILFYKYIIYPRAHISAHPGPTHHMYSELDQAQGGYIMAGYRVRQSGGRAVDKREGFPTGTRVCRAELWTE